MKITNYYGLPQALVDAVRNDPYDNGGAWRSVTQLISPPRLVVLRKRHDHEIEEDVSDRLWALYGQIVHDILARANTEDLVEERLSCEVRGKLISGGFDVMQLSKGRLSDWKFSTVYKAIGNSEDWISQVNLLVLLFRKKGIEVREAEIILLMRDHMKSKARRGGVYPPHGVQRIPVPLWSIDEAEHYLDLRVQLHLKAEERLPQCSGRERWAKPTIYAVMRQGRKTAVRGGVQKDKAEAEKIVALNTKHYLEVRAGESTRCIDFCSAAPFCSQFEAEVLKCK